MISFKFRIEYVLLALLIIACLPSVAAFGAGDIPDFAFLEGKAFRHGDIESILEELYKNTGKSGGFGGGLFGVAVGVASALASGGRGQKFSKSDVKRVYFGNWLRDYSQAMDIAGLSKLTAQSLVTVVSVLAFLEFGFATEEYQVTAERLGVYLPIEHIDNPKGYAEKEGDARQFHPNLRPPVDPRELEINPGNGMKNYMASENQGWDTSTALIRRTLKSSIEHARRSGGNNGPELYEAYRLLGSALHTLEDLLAHSNWCELTLCKMGRNVFCHVGDNVKVNTPNGPAPPLVTGTFGGADFLHSLLGESQDHLSESSISDLSARVAKAKEADRQNSKIDVVKGLLGKVPSGGNNDDKFQKPEEIKAKAVNLDIDKVAPEEVQRQLWDALVWRDGVMRDITQIIEKIPGLEALVEELNNALMEYIFTVIEPWLLPLLIKTTGVLKEGSAAVIDTQDQYQVWDNPNASDPSHSFLSKDHFGLVLNEPAGKVARIVVEHTVNVIVGCWWDESRNVDEAINKVLEAFHHPYYATGNSEIQNAMYEEFNKWFGGLGSDQNEVINRLSAQSVRDGKNMRIGSEDNTNLGRSSYQQGSRSHQTYGSSGGGYGSSQQQTYGGQSNTSYGQSKTSGYGGSSYKRDDTDTYGQSRNTETSGYGGGYGSKRNEESTGYGSRSNQESTGYGGGYGSRKTEESTGYGGGYGSRTEESTGYGGGYGSRKDEKSTSYGGGYGSRRTEESTGYGGGYGSRNTESSGYGGGYGSSAGNVPGGGYGSRETESSGYRGEYGSNTGNVPSGGYGGYGSSRKDEYGSSKKESSGYGGGYGSSRRDDDDSYGSSRRKDDNEYSSGGYGRGGGYASGGYGSSRRNDDNDNQPSGGYGRSGGDNYSSGGGYGGYRKKDDDESERRHRKKESEDSESYGRQRKHDDDSSKGYGGGYGGSYGGGRPSGGYGRGDDDDDDDDKHKRKHNKKKDSDDTYGAERLNINEESSGYGGGYGGGYGRRSGNDEEVSGGYSRRRNNDDY